MCGMLSVIPRTPSYNTTSLTLSTASQGRMSGKGSIPAWLAHPPRVCLRPVWHKHKRSQRDVDRSPAMGCSLHTGFLCRLGNSLATLQTATI
eukprot:711939-Amphidinium_carterae.1